MTQSSPFALAERYIQLRRRWMSWLDILTHFNEMILTPLICCFFFLLGDADPFMIASTLFSTYSAWKDWFEYQDLKLMVQRMFLICMYSGGPFIRTNDDEYLPYVFADAVVRHDMRHPHSEKDPQQEAHETHSQ